MRRAAILARRDSAFLRCAVVRAVAVCGLLAACSGPGGVGVGAGTGTVGSPFPSAGTTGAPSAGTTGAPSAGASPAGSASRSGTAPGSAAPVRPGPTATPTVTGVVASGLDAPWGVAVLPDGSALVSQRDRGDIVHVLAGGRTESAGSVAGVVPGGEGGLLGLAVSRQFATDRTVYAYLTASDENRVVRLPWDGRRVGNPQTILGGIAKAGNHDGGRLAFGPDGFLYVGTGDAGRRELSQQRDSLNGKILRIRPDGTPAPGNPFPGSPVWSLGHRNVQGLAWDEAGRMWASEFGQNRFDELNRIRPGANYGWPEVEGVGGGDRYVDPAAVWPTDDASPSGIAVAGGAVYLAALRGARLWQVPIPAGRAGTPRDFFAGEYGRLRAVLNAPGGGLWVLTNNTDGRGRPRPGDDKVLRVALR